VAEIDVPRIGGEKTSRQACKSQQSSHSLFLIRANDP
jgi:hypothetical protein